MLVWTGKSIEELSSGYLCILILAGLMLLLFPDGCIACSQIRFLKKINFLKWLLMLIGLMLIIIGIYGLLAISYHYIWIDWMLVGVSALALFWVRIVFGDIWKDW
jgi:hypothetical protein